MAQLKALFDKQWESIVGNCDSFLYLGGNEKESHKYVSELLGKETLDTTTHGKTKGRNGSYSTNYQQTARELMTPDEVRMLDNEYALLFLRGERPVMDRKYNILKHPNIQLSADGKGEPYIHGGAKSATNSITFMGVPTKIRKAASQAEAASFYTILSSDELEVQLEKENPI